MNSRERFYRTERLIGGEKLKQLLETRIAVIGLGAVGGYAVEGLARTGIGHLLLIDHDRISISNINRQIYALESTVGRPKAELARERVLDINPRADVTAHEFFVDTAGHETVIAWKPDIVIDAIDSLTPKAELLAGMYRRSVPVVSSMGAALRTDPGQIRTGDIFDTINCPLARKIRNMLKRRNVGRGIQCVYSLEIPEFTYIDPDMEECAEEPPARGRSRNLLGSLATVTGIFGLTLANLAIMTVLAGGNE